MITHTLEEESQFHALVNTSIALGGIQQQPFVDRILNVKLPPNLKGLSINRYEWTIDPDKHVDVWPLHHEQRDSLSCFLDIFEKSSVKLVYLYFTMFYRLL